MAFTLVKAATAVVAVGDSILMLWLAVTNVTLAWMSLVGFGVLAIGGILLLARSVLRDPFTALGKPGPNRMGHDVNEQPTTAATAARGA